MPYPPRQAVHAEVESIALHTRLRAGAEAEHERFHRVIPAELDALLRRNGVSSWRIYRSGRDLFHVVECENYAAFLAGVEHDPINVAWQQRMSDVLEVVHDYSDPASNTLALIWQLP